MRYAHCSAKEQQTFKFSVFNVFFFSFHEMGFFDMPAVINYILQITNKEKVDVIGHSIGATSALIMCSSRPELNDKVRSLIALAPGIFFNSSSESNIQQILSRYEPYLKVRSLKIFLA